MAIMLTLHFPQLLEENYICEIWDGFIVLLFIENYRKKFIKVLPLIGLATRLLSA